MTPQEDQTIQKLVRAVERAYASPRRMFWRGLLWGLGRGLGSLLGWIILLAILFYLFKASGLDQTFQEIMDTLGKITKSINSLPGR